MCEVATNVLKGGYKQSCGCLHKEIVSNDLTGQRFGRLTVLEPTEKRSSNHIVWKCQCDCGNVCEVAGGDLCKKKGNTQSCGCLAKETISKIGKQKAKDLTGQRFGRLTVIEKMEKRYHHSVVWKCRCDCGNVCEVSANGLRSGNTQSCGCLLKELQKEISNKSSIKSYIDKVCVYGTNLDELTTKLQKNNTSGRKGVYWDNKSRKWIAFIGFQKKTIYLGAFDKFEDAVKARERAEEELWEPTLNEFGRELE